MFTIIASQNKLKRQRKIAGASIWNLTLTQLHMRFITIQILTQKNTLSE
jgi:hypothetical protein